MGRRPVKNKKMPSEYPQISFRIALSEKEKLNKEISRTQEFLNKKRKDGEPFINKNDVFLRALSEGLSALRGK